MLEIDASQASFEVRRFTAGSPESRQQLESIGRSFILGYNYALHCDVGDFAIRLAGIDVVDRGFAFEGAAMAYAIRDVLKPWRESQLAAFMAGSGAPHIYMVHVGAGWALARIPVGTGRIQRTLHPLFKWLAFDGFGFHEGYFHHRRAIFERKPPRVLSGYRLRAFDQGLGRSMWFVFGTEVQAITRCITTFPAARQTDLWSGVGLAAAYAGGATKDSLQLLRSMARQFSRELAQGAAFAAQARAHAGNPASHTDMACQIFCEMSAAAAASIARITMPVRAVADTAPAYERWRADIQGQFA
jgi:enediyne biosynthesis protein E3